MLWVGSTPLSNVARRVRLSTTLTSPMRGPMVSWMKASSSVLTLSVTWTVTESNSSR
jgi:hypothetical protein